MEIQELCETVNQILIAEGIEIENGRTSSLVTPRNIRYYRTIGLMPAPKRLDSKSTYDDSHVKAVLSIKREQMAGLSLKEISNDLHEPSLQVLYSKSQVAPLLMLSQLPSDSFAQVSRSVLSNFPENDLNPIFGWSIKIGNSHLSGFGAPPNSNQIAAIKNILEFKNDEGDKTSRGGDD